MLLILKGLLLVLFLGWLLLLWIVQLYACCGDCPRVELSYQFLVKHLALAEPLGTNGLLAVTLVILWRILLVHVDAIRSIMELRDGISNRYIIIV